MDFDDIFDFIKGNLKAIWKELFNITETPKHKQVKDLINKFLVVFSNFCVLFLIVLLAVALIQDNFKWLFNFIASTGILEWRNIVAILFLISVAVAIFTFLIWLILWLTNWVRLVDIFKLYFVVEIFRIFILFGKSDGMEGKMPIAAELMNKVFKTSLFKTKKAETKDIQPLTPLIKPKGSSTIRKSSINLDSLIKSAE